MAQLLVLELATITANSAEALGDRVRRLRELKGWTQEDLARTVGVTRNQVYLVESGTTRSLQARVREAYAEALGVSEHYLVWGEERLPEEELPTLDSYLRLTSALNDEQIAYVRRSVRAMEAERELAILREQRSGYGDIDSGREEVGPRRTPVRSFGPESEEAPRETEFEHRWRFNREHGFVEDQPEAAAHDELGRLITEENAPPEE